MKITLGFCRLTPDSNCFLVSPCSKKGGCRDLGIICASAAAPWNGKKLIKLSACLCLQVSSAWAEGNMAAWNVRTPLCPAPRARCAEAPFRLATQPILLAGLWWVLEHKLLKGLNLMVKSHILLRLLRNSFSAGCTAIQRPLGSTRLKVRWGRGQGK